VADFVIDTSGTLEEGARRADEALAGVCAQVGVDFARYTLRARPPGESNAPDRAGPPPAREPPPRPFPRRPLATGAGRVYLVGSGQGDVLAQVAARALRELGREPPRVAVSYAAVAGDAAGMKFMSQRMPRLFRGAVLETLEHDRAVLDRAHLVFVSGGDPVLGAKVLRDSGAARWLREASARGTPMMGVSAGAIVLGAWWADWTEDEEADADAGDGTHLLECAGVVGRHVFDTHDEDDGWGELRAVATLLGKRGLLEETRLIGIPAGGALVYDAAADVPEVVGNPPFRLS
jgi:hypothetical protein